MLSPAPCSVPSHQTIAPYTPHDNGKVERYNRRLAEEFRYAREWTSELSARSTTRITTRRWRNQRHGLQRLGECRLVLQQVGRDPVGRDLRLGHSGLGTQRDDRGDRRQ